VFEDDFYVTERGRGKRKRTCVLARKRGRSALKLGLYDLEVADCKRMRMGAESVFLRIDDPKVQLAIYRRRHAYRRARARQDKGARRPTVRQIRDREFVSIWYSWFNRVLWECAQIRESRDRMDCS